jgi:hypothetical protein
MQSHTAQTTADESQADDIGGQVADELIKLISQANSDGSLEHRNCDRFPISCGMLLVPLNLAGRPRADKQMTVVGRDLSTRGISFSHEAEIVGRRFILCMNISATTRMTVEAETTWSRPKSNGLYETGCRLIRKVE